MTDELRELADAAIDGRLTPEQAARLEHLVLTDAATRRFYADYTRLAASIRWTAHEPAFLAEPAPAQPSRPRSRRRGWLIAVAAALLIGVIGWWSWPREPKAVATLTETKACKWESGTLPTEAGSGLRPGRLRLAEGLAKLTFASGAEVTLEGPADLELLTPMRCRLHHGQVMAKVPPGATGFVIDTASSEVIDYGTEFGVTVHDGIADVQVFSGHVDVTHRPTGATNTMLTGKALRFTPADVQAFNPNADTRSDAKPPPAGTNEVRISTAQGRGRDAFVMPIAIPPDRQSDTLLLVKNSPTKQADWHRKAYLALDLDDLEVRRLRTAELSLTFAPTGMGFASHIGDATFTVYGLTDETLDDWGEAELRWRNAPANRPGGTALDADKVVRIGSFTIPEGEQTGTRTVGGPELVQFLKRDTNKLVTVIVVRETLGHGPSDLVHGFVSRRHPTLAPPTLRVTVDDGR
jgi:hypothetical protein